MVARKLFSVFLSAVLVLGFVAVCTFSSAEILGIREAEQTTITCAARMNPCKILWASGKAIAPAQWGHSAGDRLEFDLAIDSFQENVKLGVRYAFWATGFQKDVSNPGPRQLELTIDNSRALPVQVPDTDGWNHFQVSEVRLPPLQPGLHHFALAAPANFCDTNVDAFVFYREPISRMETGILRPTRLIDAKEGVVLCASVDAPLLKPPDQTRATLQGLFELMSQDFGKSTNDRLFFHLTDRRRWWNTKARVVQNRYGIYVLANGKPYDRSEWCWALANYFVQDCGMPAWFVNSSSRVTGWMDWLPSLAGSASDLELQHAAAAQEAAEDFLTSSEALTNSAETVQLAVRLKYGNDIFKKFWNHAAEKQKEAAATGRPKNYDKYETLAMLSDVAGEDVLPLYKRWSGFKSEGPVDPLVLTLQLKGN